jgi:hypothetical protein
VQAILHLGGTTPSFHRAIKPSIARILTVKSNTSHGVVDGDIPKTALAQFESGGKSKTWGDEVIQTFDFHPFHKVLVQN